MKKIISVILTALFFTLTMAGCGFFGESEIDYDVKTEYVFSDSGIFLEVMAERGKKFDRAFEKILAELEEIDKQTNINREGESDVLSINLAKHGENVKIGRYTFKMIEMAKEMYITSGKAFNIAAYPLAYLWGIDAVGYTDFIENRPYGEWKKPLSFADSDIVRNLPLPAYSEILRVKDMCELDNLEVFEEDGEFYAVKSDSALKIDLGGVSKGYCADLITSILKSEGVKSAKIDLSGNLAFVGKYHGKKAWSVGISDPQNDIFSAIEAQANSTVVTSGDYERYRVVSGLSDNLYITHIIDTASGLPYGLTYDGGSYRNKIDRVVSATVINTNSAYADCLTTSACVLGLEQGAKIFAEQGVKAVLFTDDKKYTVTGGVDFVYTDRYDNYKDYELVTFDE